MSASAKDTTQSTPSPVIGRVLRPSYGRHFDALEPGQVYQHPRGYTFGADAMQTFARNFMQANPLYLNSEYARSCGFDGIAASPQMIFNVVLSLGVQNDSEKAIANLGYYDVAFIEPVYAGDTLTAMTQVVDRRDRGKDKPGIVTIRTVGLNQADRVVLQYERKVMVGRGPVPAQIPSPPTAVEFPWVEKVVAPELVLLGASPAVPRTALTGACTYFEDFAVDDVIVHANGRTIGEDHMTLTYMYGNTHPLHFDRLYSSRQSGKMSGEPIVYGGLVFAWLDGLASRDLSENSLWELGFTEGYHTQPSHAGDTLTAISRVLDLVDHDPQSGYGVVSVQLIGLKNTLPEQALDDYGVDLFVRENLKSKLGKEKIPNKVFEVERRLIIKRRTTTGGEYHGNR